MAQRIARWTSNPKVAGSIPARDDAFCIFNNWINRRESGCTFSQLAWKKKLLHTAFYTFLKKAIINNFILRNWNVCSAFFPLAQQFIVYRRKFTNFVAIEFASCFNLALFRSTPLLYIFYTHFIHIITHMHFTVVFSTVSVNSDCKTQ